MKTKLCFLGPCGIKNLGLMAFKDQGLSPLLLSILVSCTKLCLCQCVSEFAWKSIFISVIFCVCVILRSRDSFLYDYKVKNALSTPLERLERPPTLLTRTSVMETRLPSQDSLLPRPPTPLAAKPSGSSHAQLGSTWPETSPLWTAAIIFLSSNLHPLALLYTLLILSSGVNHARVSFF